MKKLKYIIAISVIFTASSCDDYLDQDNITEKSLVSFYKSPTDIDEAMAGVYNAIYANNITSEEQVAANLMDNMMFGGGGPDDKAAKWVDNFEDPTEDTYRDMWVQSYNGISRANAIIEKVPLADFSTYFNTPTEAADFKNQALGEALFMRAFFYFRLAKFFGGVPLIIAYDGDRRAPRATYTETFAQIASDLKLAIETMPATPFTSIPTARYGHANKWVAEAYLGRVFLFYTGYMSNIENQATADLPLVGGGSITGTQVATYLSDCVNNSGHKLASDFRNLWPYSYVNKASGTNILPWATTEGLAWVGQDGASPTFGTGNLETMFVQRFSFGDWGWTNGNIYTNRMTLFNSMRGNSLVPFGEGWGWCTVNPKLYSGWDDTDPRKRGSILEVARADQGTGGYAKDKGDHETGLFNKKYASLQYDNGKGANVGMFVQLYAWANADMQLMHAQDFIFMRFADVLLMHSEITKTPDGMNAVRARAKLPAVAYSMQNIKDERLHEFAFEALHWFDLVRWGDVNTAFNDVIQVRNSGVDANYSVKYRPETKGLVPIPETEMRLLNGVYTQNPGW
ncbi:RagB/SusD family nutrient uptake outer membrane protein [Flavobacterium quisquiliarum]|uniref:RagB/SusD family nutrient uptake outer membrane protein n=1 Tax=Flavobacterium quisquiliarum TaxID=1834436 RepID=A0ABV8W6W6_9FLAO|nr:RagB/SusD family nutrient uptake outer membrane protein [Flavobacterium quisquiliarum]MBW1654435.1 RagB/SusD family nutrient uptake outer membrane protein [Flavobacterium quisquiliarum]NWL01133.1 RagB/SusD family nutrient uptake outer membrane protein [Flavobacterium collinsii]